MTAVILGPKILSVIEVNAFGRLGLFFTTGAKTNDIIKTQMHTGWFGFWL